MTPSLETRQISLRIDGQPLAEMDARTLTSVLVRQELCLPAMCELVFVDPAETLATVGTRPGASLAVDVGDAPLFRGAVVGVTFHAGPGAGRRVCIRAYDAVHRLRKSQPTRVHLDLTTAALARELAGPVALSVEAAAEGPLWPRILQWKQSDLELLQDTAAQSGLYFHAAEDTLAVFTAAGQGEPITLRLGEELHEAELDVNGEPACRSVAVFGWDCLRQEPHHAVATEADVGHSIDLVFRPDLLEVGGERTITHLACRTADQAQACADSEWSARVSAEVTLRASATGDARLQPGTRIETQGLGTHLDGTHVIGQAVHRVTAASGYRTEFTTRLPPPPRRATDPLFTVGVVAGVDDPENLGRVQVSLPGLGDLASEWMPVMLPGAGAGKGLIAIPDVGDHVLVMLAHDLNAQGIVLGGLHGTRSLPDGAPSGGRVPGFAFVSPGGQRVRLDDANRTLRIEDSAGNFVQLAPSGVHLFAAADLLIEAPGRGIVIRGRTVDFRRT